ncbi:MAG: hypothetical protein ACFE9M_07130 [Promethearchaeota archaeon]
MIIFQHQIIVWLTIGQLLILLLYMLSTLINYIRNKRVAALYLSLNYLAYIITLSLFLFGHLHSVFNGTTTDLYFQTSMLANVFIVAGMITIILFHGEFKEVSKKGKVVTIILGLVLIIWILLPFNYIVSATGGFQIKYITYTLMTLYGGVIYLLLTISFFGFAGKSTERKKELISLGLGSLLFFAYFAIMTAYGITQEFIILLINMIVLFVSFLCFFIGIYLPKFTTKR